MTPAQRQNFERLLSPKHVAFIGGTDAIIAIGEAKRRGFEGAYWPVNPKRNMLCDIECFATVEDLPEAPDAVFLAIPAKAAVKTIEKLREMGAGGIVCYSAGFKESGYAGQTLEAQLQDAVGNMALIGPNCYGIVNYLDKSALWPFAHGGECPGYGAAIITQSGMLSSDISMNQRSLPMTHMISAGNQAVLGIEDFIDVLCENPATRAIGVHIEGLSDIPKFERVALKALVHNTPIVAFKTGRSKIGSSLTISHTGSISGANELYEALFERTGVISVTNPSQLLETLKYLCVLERPKGSKIAGFTCSGGGATMLADYGEDIGLEFPAFDQNTTQILTNLLPPIATVTNPLDYTTPIWGQTDATEPVFRTALSNRDVQAAVLVQDYPAAGLDESKVFYQNDAMAFANAARCAGVPAAICATLPENLDVQTRRDLIEQGVAPMQGLHETLNAIKAAAWWSERRTELSRCPYQALSASANKRQCITMNEAEGKTLLREAGFRAPIGSLASSETAASVAAKIGYPVVLKMMGPKLLHKTEVGAVALNIKSHDALKQAIITMRASVQAYAPLAATDLFLVENMANPPLAELVVGLRQDPQFGWALTLGSGGILVELIGDMKTLLLPTHIEAIEKALRGLKVAQLLTGFRGAKCADLTCLAQTLLDLCNWMMTQDKELQEIEINPLFIYENTSLAVDALIQKLT
jgi:acetate---CoA ligase (ADP-forming)